jgi:6-pyruvoyltetrahydropterin/6-carboxytetrahydropterin synthase
MRVWVMDSTKRYSQYKFKFYLNASHSIYINGIHGERHPHTWEISVHMLKMRNEFILFDYIEKKIEELLQVYQDQFLNDIEPFNIINPILENICTYFKDELRDLLNREGWILLLIQISETPTRSYVINLINEENDENVNDGDLQQTKYLYYKEQEKQLADEIADRIIENVLSEN